MSSDLSFNPAPPTILHLDLNSCFASCEQQANPLYRGKPLVVAAYATPRGCILASSIEAKRLGIKTGMRVADGQKLYPRLLVLSPDPDKYRHVHRCLRALISEYTHDFAPKSIDEFVLNLSGHHNLPGIAREIKARIKQEIGDYLTVSVGISTNRFLAKLGAGLHKPDGLDVINLENHRRIYDSLQLVDLPGINQKYATRLYVAGIRSVSDLYAAPVHHLRAGFHSVTGYDWYMRLRGWEVDAVSFDRKSFGHQVSIGKTLITPAQINPLLTKLVVKVAARLRKHGYQARGIHLAVFYKDRSFWHQAFTLPGFIFDTADLYRAALHLLEKSPYPGLPLKFLSVTCFDLTRRDHLQLQLFTNTLKTDCLNQAVDTVNARWGAFSLTPARILGEGGQILDRIAFNHTP